jgi:hypothetical protein
MYRLDYVLTDDDRLLDLVESGSLPCIRSAMSEAMRIASELAADVPISGKPIDRGAIQVCDMEGRTHLTIAIQDAVRHARSFRDKNTPTQTHS